jgi:hypothetical protein
MLKPIEGKLSRPRLSTSHKLKLPLCCLLFTAGSAVQCVGRTITFGQFSGSLNKYIDALLWCMNWVNLWPTEAVST